VSKKNRLIPFDQMVRETLALAKKHSKDLTPEEQEQFLKGVFYFFAGQPFGETNPPH